MTKKSALVMGLPLAVAALALVLGARETEAKAGLPPPPEWSYYCVDATSAGELTEKANAAAARGWELFAGSPGPQGAIWCLRRVGPSPLREQK